MSYVEIFYSQRNLDAQAYSFWAQKLSERVQNPLGFMYSHRFRDLKGLEVTLNYWQSPREASAAWGRDVEHLDAQAFGRLEGYASYRLEIAEIQTVREG